MTKKIVAAGIDVSKGKLDVAVYEGLEGSFDNDPSGHKKLVKWLRKQAKRKTAVVALESTGNYGLDIALTLHDHPLIEVHYVNPMAAKGFAQAGLVRAKTDRVDARVLAELARSRRTSPWTPPPDYALQLRAITRRIRAQVNNRTREKNRLESLSRTQTTPEVVLDDIRESIRLLTQRIEALRKAAVAHVQQHEVLRRDAKLIRTIPGFAETSSAEVLGELVCLPNDLTAKQLVAQAGLDPRARQSGQTDKRRSISKMGSSHLRAALHMAAMTAVRCSTPVRTFYDVLVEERKKPRNVALVAVSRKLLCSIHAMLLARTSWNPQKFTTHA